jgi:hypothetical protein
MSTPTQGSGFLGALFDFSFSTFITGKLIRILYALGLIVCGLTALSILFAAFSQGFMAGILGLVLAPVMFLFGAMYLRVILEVLMVIFRIAENVQVIANRP